MKNTDVGFAKVKNEKYAYIGETSTRLKRLNDCTIAEIKEEIFRSGYGLVFQDGWPYKKYFDYVYECFSLHLIPHLPKAMC